MSGQADAASGRRDAATEAFTAQPLSPMRRMIAARTAEAKQTIPHFRLCEDIEVDVLSAHRQSLAARWPGESVSLNDVLVKACAGALVEVPALNIQWVEGEIHRMESVDIAVIVALEDGLSTPIVRRAHEKSVREIAAEIKALSGRARALKLKTHEILGGSFSISNLGMYGVPEFDAIINPPQCAILAVGAARATLLPASDHSIRVASRMRVTLSCDHRAVDGATGAAFLASLKRRLEDAAALRALTAA
jgi:pyruvate dehydrogenase E2 component (dihydrolipoamide acetyltransferase)